MTTLKTRAGRIIEICDAPPILGGEAAVYRGRTARGEAVAVKVLLDPDAPREATARAIALARHPDLREVAVPVLDDGRWADRPFLVSPWMPATLDRWVAASPPLAERRDLATRLAQAVARLHQAGELHRDIKPSNVFLAEGRPLLGDAAGARAPGPGRTTTYFALHTPGWAPPEQALGERRPPAADQDVYALAATIAFTLTGRHPDTPRRHTDDRLRGAASRVALRTPAMIAADRAALRRAGVPAGVTAALDMALRADPRHRCCSAADLARALRDWSPEGAGSGPLARSVRSLGRPLAAGQPASAAGARAARPWAPRPVIGLVAGAVGLAVGALLLLPSPTRAVDLPVVHIPAGTPVGDGGTLPAGLWLWRREVDQATFRAVLGVDPARDRRTLNAGAVGDPCSTYRGIPLAGDRLPAICVDATDAARFANALSTRQGLRPAYRIASVDGAPFPEVTDLPNADGWRLPSLAEWRAFIAADVPHDADCRWGNIADRQLAAALPWPMPEAALCDDGFAGLAPVGASRPNRWGVHDAFGNVAEWGADVDDRGWRRAFGGSWANPPELASVAMTGHIAPDTRETTLGFRLVRGGR